MQHRWTKKNVYTNCKAKKNFVPSQPVPSESTDKDGFHYTNPNLEFSLDKVGEAPKVDEYCPRVKIEEAIRDIGPLDLERTNIDVAAEKPIG